MSRNKSLETLSAALLVVITVVLAFAPGAWAQSSHKTLYKFTGGVDGNAVGAGLIFDQAGNLYGTTELGGSGSGCLGGPHWRQRLQIDAQLGWKLERERVI
jgi:hypothetical protein